jgi:Cu2+-exporting ATPase
MNLTGPLTLRVSKPAGDTLLAEIVRLTETAEQAGSRYVRLADRASRLYAPVVHVLAAATAVGWLAAGAGWHAALTAAVAVLIITCPCALGLAVPAVQVVAGGVLFARGIMVKKASALERLALSDVVVFDKTGTLTEGNPRLIGLSELTKEETAIASALAAASRHPLARALSRALPGAPEGLGVTDIVEQPGEGLRGRWRTSAVKLGRREFVAPELPDDAAGGSEIWLRAGSGAPRRFQFSDATRPDAAETVAALQAAGMETVVLSGDRPSEAGRVAAEAGIATWRAQQQPADKVRFVGDRQAEGHRVLMVGDGINDAPALASAFVSMSPSSAADISQTAADLVFTGNRLAPVAVAVRVARAARSLILQNFALAIGYNVIAVPLAMLGHVTPLIAAIAMSSSSIIVTGNALRLRFLNRTDPEPAIVAGAVRSPLEAVP